jgi:HAD superfamily hydrolase (TIGR01509 family)
MIKAVIFDMDGLIIDTEIIESQAIEKMILDYGKKPIIRQTGLVHEIGLGMELFDILKKQYHLKADVLDLKEKKEFYFEQIVKKSSLHPYKGLHKVLKKLKGNRIKLALASNRNIKHIQLILKELHIFDFFGVIVGPSELRKHKPHPDIYLETAKQLAIKPELCLALEDTESGVESAHLAGMKVIAIPNDYSKDHNFSKANKIVKSVKFITMELIKSL